MATAVLQPAEISSKHRIPTLDGWRGVAILLVLFEHVQDSLLHGYLRPWTRIGQHGVTIFFVLSGFLITSQLLEGPIHLKRFYVRRFFRLMPAAWTYLGALLLLSHLMRVPLTSLSDIRSCVFFYRNFTTFIGATGHFWSLSVEEQFYLAWPLLLLLAGVRRCRWIALAGAVTCAVYRWFFWAHYNHNFIGGHTQVRADALIVGCLLAILLKEHPARWSKLWALPALGVLLFCIANYHGLVPLYESVCIAGLIATTAAHPKSFQLLSFPILAWLGTISYSLYLWQEIFLPFRSPLLLCVGLPLFALGSYYCIERPFVRLGHRLTASRRA